MDLAKGRQTLLPVNYHPGRSGCNVDFDDAATIAAFAADLDIVGERYDDRIGEDSLRLLQIVADLTDMAGDLRTLKPAQSTFSIAGNPLDDRKFLQVRR